MGFFDRILNLFSRSRRQKERIEKISRRIEELSQSSEANKEKSKTIQKKQFSVPSITYHKPKRKDIAVFTPRQFGDITKMSFFIKKREEEHKKYIETLKVQITTLFPLIEKSISNEDISSATRQLKQCLPLLREVKDEQLWSQYRKLEESVKELREILLQREIAKKEAERKAREEAERQRKLAEERERKRIEQERLEKERRAKEQEERLRAEQQQKQAEIDRLSNLVTRKKADAESIRTYLSTNHVYQFYHFTDRRNIPKIKEMGGLYSWSYCEDHDIRIPNPGGDDQSRELDRRYGLQDFVRLSFCDDHPMAYRKQQEGADLVLLVIDVEVATFLETLFSDMNATDVRHNHGDNLEALKRVDIDATKQSYVRNTSPSFKPHQAECMIKTFIPIKYIKNIDNPRRM